VARPSNPLQSLHGVPAPAPQGTTAPPKTLAPVPRWHRIGHALSAFSPWALAFCLTAAYFTMDKPAWLYLNLAFCVAMPVIMVARLAWVLFGPPDAQSPSHHNGPQG
jgi:hypothetical protein